MSIDKDDILKIAKLSRLQIADADIPKITESINNILNLVDKMQQVDTSNVTPLANPHDATAILRDDVITAGNQRDKFLRNAPATSDGLYLVPKVIE